MDVHPEAHHPDCRAPTLPQAALEGISLPTSPCQTSACKPLCFNDVQMAFCGIVTRSGCMIPACNVHGHRSCAVAGCLLLIATLHQQEFLAASLLVLYCCCSGTCIAITCHYCGHVCRCWMRSRLASSMAGHTSRLSSRCPRSLLQGRKTSSSTGVLLLLFVL